MLSWKNLGLAIIFLWFMACGITHSKNGSIQQVNQHSPICHEAPAPLSIAFHPLKRHRGSLEERVWQYRL